MRQSVPASQLGGRDRFCDEMVHNVSPNADNSVDSTFSSRTMFRVDNPDYPYSCFFVNDPRGEVDFGLHVEPINWAIGPQELIANESLVPAFRKEYSKRFKKTVVVYDGVVGRSREDRTRYLQVPELKYLDQVYYQIVIQPLILFQWSDWLRMRQV